MQNTNNGMRLITTASATPTPIPAFTPTLSADDEHVDVGNGKVVATVPPETKVIVLNT